MRDLVSNPVLFFASIFLFIVTAVTLRYAPNYFEPVALSAFFLYCCLYIYYLHKAHKRRSHVISERYSSTSTPS
jgi:hypothetical protein